MSAKGSGSPPPPPKDRGEALRHTLLKLRQKLLKDTERELSSYIKGDDRQSVEDVLDTGDWSVFELTDTLKLKALESIVGVTVVDPRMLEQGWVFSEVSENNPIPGIDYLHQVYKV